MTPPSTALFLSNGKRLDLEDPDPAAIDAEVIAHGLSRIPRFAGQGRIFVSVAEHSLLTARIAADDNEGADVLLACLLHDAPEGLGLTDIPTGLKALLGTPYREAEAKLFGAIFEALGVDVDVHSEARKRCDLAAMAIEARECLADSSTWTHTPLYEGPRLTLGLTPEAAKRAWLDSYAQLRELVAA
jgi:uncharacterized protein